LMTFPVPTNASTQIMRSLSVDFDLNHIKSSHFSYEYP
jgi:hypothetical protein